jgi:ERCC4-type nuclease
MLLKIDVREHELFAKCTSIINNVPKFKDICIVSEQLPLGDIIIHDGTNDCLIIERKTLTDLAASIKDGRYEEQSYRLNGLSHHNHNIVYLIEGDMYRFNSFKERIDKQTLYSAMFSIQYFKGFSVMRSNHIDETAAIICNMVCKLTKELNSGKTAYYKNKSNIIINASDDTNTEDAANVSIEPHDSTDEKPNEFADLIDEKQYCSVVKKVKKENVTHGNIGEIMLCQIPGVSSISAIAILSQFNTLPNLIRAIQEDATCLNNVCTTDSNGKQRKISKTTIATVIKYLQ